MKQAWEIWNELLRKPEESLTAIEQTIRRVNIFECEVLGGGWLYNLGPAAGEGRQYTELRRTAESIAEIGESEIAVWLVQVAIIAEKMRLAENWGDSAFETEDYRQIELLEKRISAKIDSLDDQLVAFTRQHFDCK